METATAPSELHQKLSNALYFLTYDETSKKLSLWINRSCLPHLTEVVIHNRVLPLYKEKYFSSHTSYDEGFVDVHGFNRCGIVQAGTESHLEVSFELSPQVIIGDEPCPRCNGTGKNKLLSGNKCFDCRGTKKKHEYDSTILLAICNTLSLLLLLLDAITDHKTFTETHSSQPYMLRTATHREMNGFSIGGSVGPALLSASRLYFEKKKVEDETIVSGNTSYAVCKEARLTMIETLKFLTADTDSNAYRHSLIECAVKPNGFFFIQTEGTNGCHFYASSTGIDLHWKREQGAPIADHNIDAPIQQIVLIIGLVRLSEIALSGE